MIVIFIGSYKMRGLGLYIWSFSAFWHLTPAELFLLSNFQLPVSTEHFLTCCHTSVFQ